MTCLAARMQGRGLGGQRAPSRARSRYAVHMVRRDALLSWLGLAVGAGTPPGARGADDASATPDAAASDASVMPDAGPIDAGFTGRIFIGGERPARVYVPASYDGATPLPLVVLLHGFGVDGPTQDVYWGLSRRVDLDHFFLVVPDGTPDSEGRRFWN